MDNGDYLRLLVEDIHSTIVATIGEDGRPQVRAIDMMLWDDAGVYFLTARGKAFYRQLVEQGFVALSGVKDGRAVSLRGKVRCIGSERLDEIFEKNPYMQHIYPGKAREALEVFVLFEAQGEYFDISDPDHVVRADVRIGDASGTRRLYVVGAGCTGCGSCATACPQSCIDVSHVQAAIDQGRCLHCGACVPACPEGAIAVREA